MRTQQVTTHKAIYSFETEDFEQWQLSALNASDEPDDGEYESWFDEESLAGNVVDFLGEVSQE